MIGVLPFDIPLAGGVRAFDLADGFQHFVVKKIKIVARLKDRRHYLFTYQFTFHIY